MPTQTPATNQINSDRIIRGRYHPGFFTVVAEWITNEQEFMLLAYLDTSGEPRLGVGRLNGIRRIWELVNTPLGFERVLEMAGEKNMVPMSRHQWLGGGQSSYTQA